MPYVSTEQNAQYWEPVATGPVAQMDLSTDSAATGAVPSTIVASGNFTSNLISADGFKAIAAGVQLTQAGTIAIQRYVDKAGLVPQGAAVSATLVASTPNSVSINDGNPFQSFTVKISNTGASTATVSDFVLLLNAN